MNVSLRWLRDLAPDLDASVEEIGERLTHRGFPVEGMTDLSRGLSGIRLARVEAVRDHPDADRLRLCDVNAGGEERLQVVCGAPNVREGGWYPFAPVGSTLPGGMAIRKARIRGEASHGMLCSEKELGLGRGADGLMELEGSFEPGASFVEALALDDIRLDVEVTSNRPDLLSHRGIAREVLPAGTAGLRLPPVPGESDEGRRTVENLTRLEGDGEVVSDAVRIRLEAPDLCPRYLGLVLRGVSVGPSPAWLQARLRAIGARPVNNVVDATNHVLHELGHPLHAFDLGRIGGGTVRVRRASDGESIRTLDGVERTLTGDMLAICDDDRPIAVAGVMGGADSEVTEDTRDVLLECALFTPGPVRSTRKALGMSTDASYRFERGCDPDGLEEAIRRCARLVQAVAGGTVEGPILDAATERYRPAGVTLRLSRIEAVLGVPFTDEEVRELLEPLGFRIDGQDGLALSVGVPGWRSWDVTREIDLIEEIARSWGYDRFPDTLRPYRSGSVPDDPRFALEDRLRTEMAAWGLLEAQHPAFAPEGEGEVEVLNPVSSEEGRLRSSLLPALVRSVEYNLARGSRDVRLYELGTVFEGSPEGDLPDESTRLAVVLHGRRRPEHWTAPDEAWDAWDLKGLLEAVGHRLLGDGAGLRADDADGSPFAAGTCLRLVDPDGRTVGRGGAIDPGGLDLPPWAGRVWGAEVTLPESPGRQAIANRDRPAHPLPAHPGVDRDLSLLVPDDLPVERVLALLGERGGGLLRDTTVFDLYRGRGVPDGTRSVAVRLRFRADGRTLTDREVDEVIGTLSQSLQEDLGVGIRGG